MNISFYVAGLGVVICHIFFKLCNASFSLVIGPNLFSVNDSNSSNDNKKSAFPSIS